MKYVLIVLYVVVSVLNFGAINAEDKERPYYCGPSYSFEDPRHIAAESAIISAFPIVGSFVALTETGFMEHGFSWKIGCTK